MIETSDNYLRLKDLVIFYGKLKVVKNVSFDVTEGSIVSLLGANGSGKSTILRTISGLKKLAGGEIWFEGGRIDHQSPQNIIGAGIVHVPERRSLFPHMSVFENLLMGAYSRKKAGRKDIENDIEEIYQYFPILKAKAKKRAITLSGGEAEQLAIARALMAKPKLLLMDEPLQGIAPIIVKEIANLIRGLNKKGITILMVEHNITMSFKLSDWIYILDTGKLAIQGKPQDLSKTEFVKEAFLGV